MKKDNIALVDLDGTLADWDGAMNRDLKKLMGPGEIDESFKRDEAPEFVKNRMTLIMSNGSWWDNLPKFKLGFDILEILKEQKFYISILTQGPRKNPIAWTHKVEWCKKHVPDLDITITRNKGLVYGKILVDDWPEYIEQWLKHRPRGIVIMPAQPWNKDFKHPKVYRYDGSNIDQMRTIITAVKNRNHGEGIVL